MVTSGFSSKLQLKVGQKCNLKWRNLSRIKLSRKSCDIWWQIGYKWFRFKIPTKSWPKAQFKMTKLKANWTFQNKLRLTVTNWLQLVVVVHKVNCKTIQQISGSKNGHQGATLTKINRDPREVVPVDLCSKFEGNSLNGSQDIVRKRKGNCHIGHAANIVEGHQGVMNWWIWLKFCTMKVHSFIFQMADTEFWAPAESFAVKTFKVTHPLKWVQNL